MPTSRAENEGPYVALLIALLFTLPVLIWNWQMDFVSFKHIAFEGKTTLTFGKRLTLVAEYLGSEIGMLSPFLFVFIVPTIYRALRDQSTELKYLAIAPTIVFGFFLLYSFNKRVEVNWPFFSYFSIPILLAHYYDRLSNKRWFRLASITSVFLIIPVFYLSAYLQPLGLNRVVPPKKDPIRRLYGWQALGDRVQQLVDEYGSTGYFIFSDSYHVASEVAFYTSEQQVPFCINLGRRHNQFDLWPGIEQFEGTDQIGIFVTKEGQLPEVLAESFHTALATEVVEIELGGEVVWTYHIAVLEGLIHLPQKTSQSY